MQTHYDNKESRTNGSRIWKRYIFPVATKMSVFFVGLTILVHFGISFTMQTNHFVAYSAVPSNLKLHVGDDHKEPLLRPMTGIECVRSCLSQKECRAVNIDVSRHCELLVTTVCDGFGYLTSAPGFQYYEIITNVDFGKLSQRRSCHENYLCEDECETKNFSTVGRNCSTTSPCLVADGECRGGVCRCSFGFSYNSHNDSCTKGCIEYGTRFVKETGWSLAGHNTVTLNNISLQDCLDRCINSTFVCRSVDYNSRSEECFLSMDSCVQFPQDCIPSSLDHYSRDCL